MRLTLFCHKFPPFGDEETEVGDIGGVETGGNNIAEELRANGLIALSGGLAERDLGDGMPEPVEA